METFLGLFKRSNSKKEESEPTKPAGSKPCQAQDCMFYALPDHPEPLCSYCAKKFALGHLLHYKDPALELQQQENLLVKRESEIAVVKKELELYYDRLMKMCEGGSNGAAFATNSTTASSSTTTSVSTSPRLDDLNTIYEKKKSKKHLLKKDKKERKEEKKGEKEEKAVLSPRERNDPAFDVNLFAVRFDDTHVPDYVRSSGGGAFFKSYLAAPPTPTLNKNGANDYRYRQERRVQSIPFIVEFRNPNATSIYMRFEYNLTFASVYRFLATRIQCNTGLLELFYNGRIILRQTQTQRLTEPEKKTDSEYEEFEADSPLSNEALRCLQRGTFIRATDNVRDVLNCLIINVIHVRDVPPPSTRTITFFTRVNRRINSLHIDRHGDEGTCGLSLNSDILLRIVRHLSWDEALDLSMVSVYWYLTIVRYFLLIQLDINCTFKEDQPYPFVLNTWINEYTYQLAQSSARPDRFEHLWNEINPQKFYFSGHSMKTIYYNLLDHDFHPNRCGENYLLSSRHEFFTLFKPVEFGVSLRDGKYVFSLLNERPFSAESDYLYDEAKQERPAKGSCGFITEAIVPLYLNGAISIISSYFSQNMKYFIPLMVYKEKQYGLDFSTCRTSVVFGSIAIDEDPLQARPVGAVIWRVHRSQCSRLVPAISVLEVLFLAMESNSRQQDLATTLVDHLKEIMRAEDISILYVEIGNGTPWAIKFWTRMGLEKVIEGGPFDRVHQSYFDANCLRFSDTRVYAGFFGKDQISTNNSPRLRTEEEAL